MSIELQFDISSILKQLDQIFVIDQPADID